MTRGGGGVEHREAGRGEAALDREAQGRGPRLRMERRGIEGPWPVLLLLKIERLHRPCIYSLRRLSP